ncbi:MAG: hypothetical protein OEW36_04115 [Hylemonella sp.]|nr:hypothetical protein [Hylemonella sp.]
MIHRPTLLALLLCLGAPALHAAEPGFWEMLRMKIEMLTPQKKLSTTTAVGGVRGAPIEAQGIYWKGEAKPQQEATDDELAAFQRAMALAEAGQGEEAKLGFAEFSRSYPDSPLRAHADQALAHLMVEGR